MKVTAPTSANWPADCLPWWSSRATRCTALSARPPWSSALRNKKALLPPYCRQCEFLFACNGECPKHRFARTPAGDAGLSYLCTGLRSFFKHATPKMDAMACLVQAGRPAAEIMKKTS